MFKFFDSHCHLQLSQYKDDLAEVLARMQDRQTGALMVGVDFETSKAGLELAKQHDFLWASVGLHPNDNETEQFSLAKYEELARDPKVVAIGECGFDYYHSDPSDEEKQKQKERFLMQIELAQKTNKALVIHCRNAHGDLFSMLVEKKLTVPVIIHFFTGSTEVAQKYLDLGCYLSFAGPVTFTDMYDDSIRLCPLDKMLIETDAPFATPAPYRGRRNEPGYVEYVAVKIAQIKNITTEEVAAATAKNAREIFRLQ